MHPTVVLVRSKVIPLGTFSWWRTTPTCDDNNGMFWNVMHNSSLLCTSKSRMESSHWFIPCFESGPDSGVGCHLKQKILNVWVSTSPSITDVKPLTWAACIPCAYTDGIEHTYCKLQQLTIQTHAVQPLADPALGDSWAHARYRAAKWPQSVPELRPEIREVLNDVSATSIQAQQYHMCTGLWCVCSSELVCSLRTTYPYPCCDVPSVLVVSEFNCNVSTYVWRCEKPVGCLLNILILSLSQSVFRQQIWRLLHTTVMTFMSNGIEDGMC